MTDVYVLAKRLGYCDQVARRLRALARLGSVDTEDIDMLEMQANALSDSDSVLRLVLSTLVRRSRRAWELLGSWQIAEGLGLSETEVIEAISSGRLNGSRRSDLYAARWDDIFAAVMSGNLEVEG